MFRKILAGKDLMAISKAVVTGGAGFIGGNLVNRLVDEGTEVLVIDNLSSGMLSRLAPARERGQVHFHQMDVRAPELRQVVIGFTPQVIFHLAAQIDVRASIVDPAFDADVNLIGTINLLQAAREAAVEALAEVGPPAVEMLITWLRDWDCRKYVIRALGKINDERVLDPLLSVLRNDEFKDDATRALIELGKPSVEKLIIALSDKEEYVRKQAIIALGEIKDPAAVDPLIAMLQDRDWYSRLTAAGALEKIGDLRGREAIKPLMKDPDLVVRMRVERILAAWKKQPANA